MTELRQMTIADIAALVERDWTKPYFGAVPYLDAMSVMDNITDAYGLDEGTGIITYFLSNANSWHGETARAVKAELKHRLKTAS